MVAMRVVMIGLSVITLGNVASAFAFTRLTAQLAPSRASLLCARATARPRLVSLRAAAELTPDMSDVLKRYGVPAADHAALVAELAPLLVGKKASAARVETLDVTLQRGPEGGLSLRVHASLSVLHCIFLSVSDFCPASLVSMCLSVSLLFLSPCLSLALSLSLSHSTTLSLSL